MPSARQGSIHLFRFSGIDLFLHWSWFLAAAIEVSYRTQIYSSRTWNVLEYLALFLIVMLHEFGHALACRQVGGRANQIVLWPLGGVAFVDPPPRPGATLWSIAAGPLVNVGLIPVLSILFMLSRPLGPADAPLNVHAWLGEIGRINLGLLIFNLLPIYPLDGGQILRSLLWFVIGRVRSLMAATIIGFLGVAGLILLAALRQNLWLGVISAFLLMNCWSGFEQARALMRLSKVPRRDGFACPSCKTAPPIGDHWTCARCHQPSDPFQTHAVCPHCGAQYPVTRCLDCGRSHPLTEWMVATLTPQNL